MKLLALAMKPLAGLIKDGSRALSMMPSH